MGLLNYKSRNFYFLVMIYKDSKQIELDKNKKAELRKRFTFPVRIKYVKEFITWDKVNKRNVKPPSISVPAKGSILFEGDVNEYRYASVVTKIEGEPHYTPSAITVNEATVITERDIDLLYYLYFYCPYMSNGKLAEEAKKKKTKLKEKARFQFEDIKKEAELFIEKDKLATTVKALITNPDFGVDDNDLRRIAKAMFIPNSGELDINLLRQGMLLKIESSRGTDGYEEFLAAKKNLGNTGVKAILSEAIDLALIKFEGRGRKWFWLDTDGEKTEMITPVLPGKDHNEALVEFLTDESETLEQVKTSIKEKKGQ